MKSLWFLCLLLCSCAPKKSPSVYRDIQKKLSEGTEQYTTFELSKIFIEQRKKEYEDRLAKNPDYTCLINRDSFPYGDPNPYYIRGRVVLPQIPTRDEMKRFKDVRFFVFLDKEVTVDDIARLRREDKFGHIRFKHLSDLDQDVAKEIVRLKTNSLSFPSLKRITPGALQEFTKWKGSYLSLRGLEDIDDELYELFSTLPIRSLSLRMYKDIDLETAKKLKPLFAKGLGLSGMRNISLDVLDEWRDIKIPSLALGSDDVDMETLRALSKMNISSLSLYGLTSFSQEQAQTLQSFRGKSISLDKVKDMSGETLATLAGYKKITDIGVRCL